MNTCTYTVQKGDSLWLISKKFGVALDALIAANPQIKDPDKIYPGDQVNIPLKSEGGTMPAPYEMPAPTQQHMESGIFQHIVKAGETLWLIAKKHGITLEDLIKANPQIKDPNKIDIGQSINIPKMGMHQPPKQYPMPHPPKQYPMHPMPSMHPMPTGMPHMHYPAEHMVHHMHYICGCCPPEMMHHMMHMGHDMKDMKMPYMMHHGMEMKDMHMMPHMMMPHMMHCMPMFMHMYFKPMEVCEEKMHKKCEKEKHHHKD